MPPFFVFLFLSFVDKVVFIADRLSILATLCFLGVIALLYLIYSHYRHITKIISPKYILDRYLEDFQKILTNKKPFKFLKKKETVRDDLSEYEAVKFRYIDMVSSHLQYNVDQVLNVVKKFQKKQKYAVVQYGLNCLEKMTSSYINYKGSLFFGGAHPLQSIFEGVDIREDKILNGYDGVLEKLKESSDIAKTDKDFELLRRLSNTYKNIMRMVLCIKMRGNYVDENYLFSCSAKYMEGMIDGTQGLPIDYYIILNRYIDEVIDTVGKCTNQDEIYITSTSIISILEKLFVLGAKTQDSTLINGSLRSLMLLLFINIAKFSQSNPANIRIYFDKLNAWVTLFLSTTDTSDALYTEHGLGAVIGVRKKTTLVSIFQRLCKKTLDELNTSDLNERNLIYNLDEIGTIILDFYRDVSTKIPTNHSSLYIDIGGDIQQIIALLVSFTSSSKLPNQLNTRVFSLTESYVVFMGSMPCSSHLAILHKEKISSVAINLKKKGCEELVLLLSKSLLNKISLDLSEEGTHTTNDLPREVVYLIKLALYCGKGEEFLLIFKEFLDYGKMSVSRDQGVSILEKYDKIGEAGMGSILSTDALVSSIPKKVVSQFRSKLEKFLRNNHLLPNKK